MKSIQFFISLLCLSLPIFAKQQINKLVNLEEAARAYGLNTATGTSGLATAQYTHPIIPAQVNNTGYYRIQNSGYYFLTEDLFFSPRLFTDNSVALGAINKSAIYIQSDNVILDLNSKTIEQKNSKTNTHLDVADVHTIFIQDGAKNITIKNGTINYATGHGIYIGKNCNNIVVSNMRIINCGKRGIYGAGQAANKIQDISIENCHVTGCTGTIQPDATAYGDTTDGHAIGIDLTYVENAFIGETISNNHQINSTATTNSDVDSVAAGIRLQNCVSIVCSNCYLNNNAGPVGQGILAISSSNVTFTGCKADENHSLLPSGVAATTRADGIGFHMQGSTHCNFENCQANHNYATTGYGIGFYLDGTTTTGQSSFNSFQTCTAASNAGGKTTAISSIGAGFLSSGKDNSNYNIGNAFTSCVAKGNTCQAEATENDPLLYNKAVGICLLYEDGSLIQSCKCIGNGDFTSAVTVTQTSQGGNLTVPHVLGYGIYLGPTGDFVDEFSEEYTQVYYTYTKNIVISDCWLMFNSRAGLKDDAKDCQSLIMRNYAFRNGTQNQQLSQGDLPLYSANYQVQYLQPNEQLTLTTATVGGFGALNVANPYANVEWQVSDTSSGYWDIGQSPTTVDSIN